ncbi:MAG TPA: RodZ domain-containing protein [Egibacteraceae bacterium]|nr:RodZ domain-containing protein [Egibacteraceae bacterium]
MATGIGETLRAARRRHGRTLADAAAETRVRESYLAALEEEEFAALGGGVYVKGFLRSYAKFLSLDPEPLLEAYRAEYERDEDTAPVREPVGPMLPPERRSGPAVIVVAAGALLLVLAGLGMFLGRGGDPDTVGERGPAPAETPEAASPTPPTTTTAPSPPATVDPTDPEVEGIEVVVAVTGEVSWMRVEVDGDTVLEGVQSSGFRRTFTGQDLVRLRIGDASAVAVEANGRDQGRLGSAGQVVVVTCPGGDTECDVDVVA